MKRKILLFSTLSPYPFWAGSEKYWFDLVIDPRTRERFEFHIRLADSPVTRQKVAALEAAGAKVRFYKHHNTEFFRRNFSKLRDRVTRRRVRTLPWYEEIAKGDWHLVWFNVDNLLNFHELEYAYRICDRSSQPYWLMLQHGHEQFFPGSDEHLEILANIAVSAKRFVFIAERNKRSFERAIGMKLNNVFLSRNSLPAAELERAKELAKGNPVNCDGPARFFTLGRFSPDDKGQHLLLEAFARSEWKNRDWTLELIGVSGFGARYIERLARFYELDPDRVRSFPFAEKVFEEIAGRDVLLMPSLAEGTPFAMIESMAMGRPAVGTPIGGIPELVIDGKTGWLSRTTNVDDISEAMERMWAERPKWQTIGEAARSHILANNDQHQVFAETLELLSSRY